MRSRFRTASRIAGAGDGAAIAETAKRARVSQEVFADESELHWTYFGQVERGQANVSLHNILRIAR